MSAKQHVKEEKVPKRKLSKRDKRMRLFVYIMIIAMLLSTLTAGVGGLLM